CHTSAAYTTAAARRCRGSAPLNRTSSFGSRDGGRANTLRIAAGGIQHSNSANMNRLNMISPMFRAMPRCRKIAPQTQTGRSRVHTINGNPISRARVKTFITFMYSSHQNRWLSWHNQMRTWRKAGMCSGENSGLVMVYQTAVPSHHELPLSFDSPADRYI